MQGLAAELMVEAAWRIQVGKRAGELKKIIYK
jgi:hypothetical protein